MAEAGEKYVTADEQQATMATVFEFSIESILHDILLDIHREEKLARMQTAVVELGIRAEKLGKTVGPQGESIIEEGETVDTKAATTCPGGIQLKGNPMKHIKHHRCPNCRLQRLWYPRVGFNSRPVPDLTAQYCKSEPVIIIDKHDVHGQRKKGVKMKGQPKAKGKNNKLRDASPASSMGDPQTPQQGNTADSFEFKEIEFPAAKCPNRNTHLGDHWKAVNVFATHLNGNCWLKKDRAAMREANAKISGTPKDSRASSPKPASTNGVKRKADEKDGEPVVKKKLKMSDHKRADRKNPPAPSKLREQSLVDDDDGDDSSGKGDIGDTIQLKTHNAAPESAVKLKFSNPGVARKKPSKTGKKS